jgi:competence protein ComEA
MDTASPPAPPASSSTAITAAVVPLLAPLPAVAPPSTPSDVLLTWPRSAQWATVFLLGVATTLLGLRCLGSLVWGARPTELERGAALTYRIDVNHAPRAELLQLPGVGKGLAERIEAYRQAYGGFRSVDDLRKVHGIGPVVLEKLRPWVTVRVEDDEEEMETPVAVPPPRPVEKRAAAAPKTKGKKEASLKEPINVNLAPLAELQKLPGVGPKISQRIVDVRNLGPFKTVDELRRVPGIGPKTMEKLRPYVTIGSPPAKVVAAEGP